jgi:transposase-like protein
MKTQLSKPSRTKARYIDQYKQEALELWRASGRSAARVAAELGIRPPLLSSSLHSRQPRQAIFMTSAISAGVTACAPGEDPKQVSMLRRPLTLQQAPKMSRHFLGRQPASALLHPNYQ